MKQHLQTREHAAGCQDDSPPFDIVLRPCALQLKAADGTRLFVHIESSARTKTS